MTPLKITYTGLSGTNYLYEIYELRTPFIRVAGNYAFSRRNPNGLWEPLYFGETEDLSTRFGGHHKLDLVLLHGATHIHAHANDNGVYSRRQEEQDLIRRYNPKCNG